MVLAGRPELATSVPAGKVSWPQVSLLRRTQMWDGDSKTPHSRIPRNPVACGPVPCAWLSESISDDREATLRSPAASQGGLVRRFPPPPPPGQYQGDFQPLPHREGQSLPRDRCWQKPGSSAKREENRSQDEQPVMWKGSGAPGGDTWTASCVRNDGQLKPMGLGHRTVSPGGQRSLAHWDGFWEAGAHQRPRAPGDPRGCSSSSMTAGPWGQ